jgi:hypothetical protein
MTIGIETASNSSGTNIRLIGRMRAEHLEELKGQIQKGGPNITLDLEQLSLVDVEAARFLGKCQTRGVSIIGCSTYIRDWIAGEADPEM